MGCYNSWANLRCSSCSPLGEKSLWNGTIASPFLAINHMGSSWYHLVCQLTFHNCTCQRWWRLMTGRVAYYLPYIVCKLGMIAHIHSLIDKKWGHHQMETFSALLALVRGIHRWIIFTKASDAELWWVFFICAWIDSFVNNRKAGDLRRHRVQYDVTVMTRWCPVYRYICR